MKTELDFIEKYFPNYYSSEDIARMNDLQKLIDEEYVEGDASHQLLISEFGGDYKQAFPSIVRAHIEITERVYQQAIMGYIRQGGK